MMMQVEEWVERIDEFKGSKMKELVLKKRTKLEEICKTNIIVESNTTLDNSIASMDSFKFS